MLSKYLILFSATVQFSAVTLKAQETKETPKQYKNTVKLATASVHIPHETGTFRPFGQVGAYYERKILGNWTAGIGYVQWLTVPNGLGYEARMGGLAYREHYRMIDIYGLYDYRFCKVHHLTAGLGGAYTRGLNIYFAGTYGAPFEEDWLIQTKDESFWALVPQASYSYYFLNNRLQLGTDFRLRHYLNKLRPQYDLGAHIGFMF